MFQIYHISAFSSCIRRMSGSFDGYILARDQGDEVVFICTTRLHISVTETVSLYHPMCLPDRNIISSGIGLRHEFKWLNRHVIYMIKPDFHGSRTSATFQGHAYLIVI